MLPLQVAYQVTRTLVVSRAARREPALDVARVQALLDQIRGQLESVRAMKTNLTKAKGSIGEVENLLDQAKSSILDTIKEMERELIADPIRGA